MHKARTYATPCRSHVDSYVFECTQNFLCVRYALRAQRTQCAQLVLLEVHSSTSIIGKCFLMCTDISREKLYRYNMYSERLLYCTRQGTCPVQYPYPTKKFVERNGGAGSREPAIPRERRFGHAHRLKSSCQYDQ